MVDLIGAAVTQDREASTEDLRGESAERLLVVLASAHQPTIKGLEFWVVVTSNFGRDKETRSESRISVASERLVRRVASCARLFARTKAC
jgi:hypothetical protein